MVELPELDQIFRHVLGPDAPGTPLYGTVALPFEARQKARQRVALADGRAVGLKLPRNTVLRDGALLASDSGATLQVTAAPEILSVASHRDLALLARAAYHLGNRHVWVQVGAGWLRYQHDHVLDAMVRGLGLSVESQTLPFEPEAGAYGAHESAHSHAH